VDIVMLSHVHWDHVGTPSDFPRSRFVVGSGTMHLLSHGAGPLYPAELFNADELPRERTVELPPTHAVDTRMAFENQTDHSWKPLSVFPHAIDFFGDGALYVIDAPGHLQGHVNLLARIAPKKWVYLGGDCCHDPRILSKEKGIALYDDGRGGVRSVHADTDEAARTVERAARLFRMGGVKEDGGGDVDVEVVVAHDGGWAAKNASRFWPGHL
jgi:glyoxylase-like metal-dependent hydrolase (beta-lactamase superfamily II)